MPTTTVPRPVTYEEWLAMPNEHDGREEVADGEIVRMPPNRLPHALIIENLIDLIKPQVDRQRVRVIGSDFGLLISKDPLTCRSPDVACFWQEGMVVENGLVESPPGLIIEVISPSETKRRKEAKLRDYAKIGVPEVWLLSPEAQSVEVRQLKDNSYGRTALLVDGEIRPTRFPDIIIDVASIWPSVLD